MSPSLKAATCRRSPKQSPKQSVRFTFTLLFLYQKNGLSLVKPIWDQPRMDTNQHEVSWIGEPLLTSCAQHGRGDMSPRRKAATCRRTPHAPDRHKVRLLSIGRDLRYQLKRSIAASAHGILRSGFLQWV